MKRSNYLLVNVLFVLVLCFIFSFSSVVDAQRGRLGKSCGQGCTSDAECRIGTFCENGACYETGCNPARDSACCKSQRPRTPTKIPTGVPVVPTVPLSTPGSVAPPPTGPITNLTPGTSPLTPYITAPVGGGGAAGDCSGLVEGTKDGKVDLMDFNLLRKEFSGSAKTTFCDFDTNAIVDLLDFNIQRIALIAQK